MTKDAVRIQEMFRKIHECSLCHSNPNGTIKPDPEKIVRKFYPQLLKSDVFMIAQSLAADQVRLSGIPFHNTEGVLSAGGKFLEQYLNLIGYTISPSNLDHKLIYSTDIVQCYPGKRVVGTGDNIPLASEIDNCKIWLSEELKLLQPKVILLFGTPATKTFYKHYLHERFTRLADYYLVPMIFNESSVFALPHPTSMVKSKSDIYLQTFEKIRKIIS